MDIQVLVTSMYQADTSLFQKMNLQTDAIIANQSDYNGYLEEIINGHKVQLITTNTRGLSRNRNIAMTLSMADVIIFADDDMKFLDGYELMIENEFNLHPEANAIKFYVESTGESRPLTWKQPQEFQKATRRKVGSAGVVGMAMKREIFMRYSMFFHENFGTGTENYRGEDSLYLQNMINRGVGLYISPTKISEITQGKSSWFTGYNEKYFIVGGKIWVEGYPLLAYPLAVRSAYRFSKNPRCSMKFKDILKCYCRGIRQKY